MKEMISSNHESVFSEVMNDMTWLSAKAVTFSCLIIEKSIIRVISLSTKQHRKAIQMFVCFCFSGLITSFAGLGMESQASLP